MDTPHRWSRRRFSAWLALPLLFATLSTPVPMTPGVHAHTRDTSTHATGVRAVSFTSDILEMEPSADVGELPTEYAFHDCELASVRAEREPATPARPPAPPLVGGTFQHLRI